MLRGLTDEELRSLEGMERGNVEARIAVLRNIQRLLDSAVAQMVQYSAVMANIGSVLCKRDFHNRTCWASLDAGVRLGQDFRGTLTPLVSRLAPPPTPLRHRIPPSPLHNSHLLPPPPPLPL